MPFQLRKDDQHGSADDSGDDEGENDGSSAYNLFASRVAPSSPGSAHTNPKLTGGPGDEAADTDRCWQERLLAGGSEKHGVSMSPSTAEQRHP